MNCTPRNPKRMYAMLVGDVATNFVISNRLVSWLVGNFERMDGLAAGMGTKADARVGRAICGRARKFQTDRVANRDFWA